jgi:predicted DNA-binding protein with PD1-like motif
VKYKLVSGDAPSRRFTAVLEMDDDVLAELQRLCERERVLSATLYGIGGFRRATLAYYDMERKQYEPIAVDEQVEAVSFIGNVTQYQNKAKIHVHCAVGRRDGSTASGHLLSATARPTLELVIVEIAATLRRTDRPEIGIPLIDL